MSEAAVAINTSYRVVDSDQKAEWALRDLREIIAERDKMTTWYKRQIVKIEEQAEFDISQIELALSEYFATVPHKKTKTQESYALPSGQLVMKTQNPEFKRDDAQVIDWLKKNNMESFVKTKESLDWEGLKGKTDVFGGAVVNEDGTIIPGIEVIEREPKFVVKV